MAILLGSATLQAKTEDPDKIASLNIALLGAVHFIDSFFGEFRDLSEQLARTMDKNSKSTKAIFEKIPKDLIKQISQNKAAILESASDSEFEDAKTAKNWPVYLEKLHSLRSYLKSKKQLPSIDSYWDEHELLLYFAQIKERTEIGMKFIPVIQEMTKIKSKKDEEKEARIAQAFAAAASGNLETISEFIESGGNPEQTDPHQGTLLLIATKAKHKSIITFLMDKGADPFKESGMFETPALTALSAKDDSLALLFLHKGVPEVFLKEYKVRKSILGSIQSIPNSLKILLSRGFKFEANELRSIVENEDTKDLEALLKAGLNPNSIDLFDRKLLILALKASRPNAALLLLKNGATFESKDWKELSSLDLPQIDEATRFKIVSLGGLPTDPEMQLTLLKTFKGRDSIQSALKQFKFSPSQHPHLTGEALENNQIDLLHALLSNGWDPNQVTRNYFGSPLLITAIGHKQFESAKLILDFKPNLENRSGNGTTALMEAVMALNPELVQLLLKLGANPHAKDDQGNSVLVQCFSRTTSSEEETAALEIIVKHLYAYDANLNGKDSQNSPDFFAALRDHLNPSLVDFAMGRVTNKNALDDRGQNFVMAAILQRLPKLAEIGIKNGVSAIHKDNEGNSALHLAAWLGDDVSAAALLKAGAPSDGKNSQGQTPAMLAFGFGHEKVLKKLSLSNPEAKKLLSTAPSGHFEKIQKERRALAENAIRQKYSRRIESLERSLPKNQVGGLKEAMTQQMEAEIKGLKQE